MLLFHKYLCLETGPKNRNSLEILKMSEIFGISLKFLETLEKFWKRSILGFFFKKI